MSMAYTAKNLDVQKCEYRFLEMRQYQQQKCIEAKKSADSFFSGYEKALDDVSSMFHCSNYESTENLRDSHAYGQGFLDALAVISAHCQISVDDFIPDVFDAGNPSKESLQPMAEKLAEQILQK